MSIKPKAIFISESSQHIFLFAPIIKKLSCWDTLIINFSDNLSEMNFADVNYLSIINLDRDEKDIKNLLISEQPAIVITAHDKTEITNFIINFANSIDVPTLMIQDGLFDFPRVTGSNITSRFLSFLRLIKSFWKFLCTDSKLSEKIRILKFKIKYRQNMESSIYGTGNSSKIAVFGRSTKEFLISIGVDQDKIVITGSPKFDRMSQLDLTQNLKTKKVVLLTQPLVENGIWGIENRDIFVKSIFNCINGLNDDVKLIIKLHPFEKKQDYENIFKKIPHNLNITKNSPIKDVINEADLAITLFSTAGLEAIAMGVPLIIVNLFQDKIIKVYENMEIIQITQEMDIQRYIDAILYDNNYRIALLKKYQDSLRYHIYSTDTESADRIALLINNMVGHY